MDNTTAARTLKMVFAKSTKNTHVFNEQVSAGETPTVPSLYIGKNAFAGDTAPAAITLTITPV